MSIKYLIISVDWREIVVSLALGFLSGWLTTTFNLYFWPSLIINGVFCSIAAYTIINGGKFLKRNKKDEYEVYRNLSDVITTVLLAVANKPNEDANTRKKRLYDLSNYLKMINELESLIEFQPNNVAINMLHNVNGTISITEKAPREWLNPTYNFFLIKHYISSLRNEVNSRNEKIKLEFSANRGVTTYTNYEKRKKQILEDLSKLDTNDHNALNEYLTKHNICVRFFFLSLDEVTRNRSVLETLIAGHELFGCYLYIIIDDTANILFKDDIKKVFDIIKYEINENENKTDIMIAARLNERLLHIVHRKNNELQSDDVSDASEIIIIQKYIKKIGKYLYEKYDDRNSVFNYSARGFTYNSTYQHIYVDKVT